MILDDGGDLTNLVHAKYPQYLPGKNETVLLSCRLFFQLISMYSNFFIALLHLPQKRVV